MTVIELITQLAKYDSNQLVVVSNGTDWTHIFEISEDEIEGPDGKIFSKAVILEWE